MNGNEKGGEFERSIAKKLSTWLTHGAGARVLWRTPGSGAMAHRLAPELQKWTAGDIGVLDKDCVPACRFVSLIHLELKFYKSLEWHQLVAAKGFLWSTWDKTWVLANEAERVPMVVAKQNRQEELALAEPSLWRRLNLPCVAFYNNFGIVPLKTLLREVDPETFLDVVGKEHSAQYESSLPPRIERRPPTTHS